MDFDLEWGNYRNMCRMSKIANISKEKFKIHLEETKQNGKQTFIHFHETRVRQMIEGLAFRIGYNVTFTKKE